MTPDQARFLGEALVLANRDVRGARDKFPEATADVPYGWELPSAIDTHLRSTWAQEYVDDQLSEVKDLDDLGRSFIPDDRLPNYDEEKLSNDERLVGLRSHFLLIAADRYGLAAEDLEETMEASRRRTQVLYQPTGLNDSLGHRGGPLASSTSNQPCSLGELDEPGPRTWMIAGLIPEDAVTILAGHSGVGKSYVALHIAISVCVGAPFLGKPVEEGPVLLIDRELDRDETLRRAYQVARGMGLTRPPNNLYYLRPEDPIGTDKSQLVILNATQETGAALVILDSLTVGSIGDATEQRDVVKLMKAIEAWGTVLAIDHFTKAGAAGNQSSATIFGSTFKRAIARSTMKLSRADGGALTLRPDKNNFGPTGKPLHFTAEHLSNEYGEGEVVFTSVTESDESMAGAEKDAPAHEQTFIVLHRLYAESGQPVPLRVLAEERDCAEKTIRNYLSLLKHEGRIEGFENNTYQPVLETGPDASHDHSQFPTPRVQGTGNEVKQRTSADPWNSEDSTGLTLK